MTIQCPYCNETIQAGAKKCRYCGEWMETPQVSQRGSSGARAMTRGLKQKQFDDSMLKVGVFFGIICGAGAAFLANTLGVKGNTLYWIALGVMVGIWILVGLWYWHE